ncbi:MAG: amidohydrolase family protein [Planctomycetota bacterium]|jgi:predicted TIM-barrel fold metal-dependent hydrolase
MTTAASSIVAFVFGALVVAASTPSAAAPRQAQAEQPPERAERRMIAPPAGTAIYVGDEMVRDYDPRPALVNETTDVPAARFPAVDIHCHWSIDRDPAELLAAMDERNVSAAVNLSGAWGEELEAMLERFHDHAPGRLVIFGTPEFDLCDEPGWAQRTERAMRNYAARGMAGIKIYKSLGLRIRDSAGDIIPIDDPRIDVVWKTCGELGLPVLIHISDPPSFFEPVDRFNERWMQLKRHPDWDFSDESLPSRAELFDQRARVMERNRGTNFIGAHVGSHATNLAEAARQLDTHPNFFLDISGRVGELGRQPYSSRTFLVEYQDRVLFGTDRYPGREDQPRYRIYFRFLESDDEYFKYYDHPFPPSGDWRIYGVFLDDGVLEKVYAGNARTLLLRRDDATRSGDGS